MDDRKEGVPEKQSSDPFDQPNERPPMTKLQRSILVENQKHNIQQIGKLSDLLHKLHNCEKILQQQVEAPGRSMVLMKTPQHNSKHGGGPHQQGQTLEQVRSSQVALRKMKWQKLQMEAQQQQLQGSGVYNSSNQKE